MKQVAQSLSDGNVQVLEVPEPVLGPHSVLVRTTRSLVSVGTERTKIELGRSSLVEKARRRPDDVKKVLDRVRRDGLLSTYRMVKGRLEQASPLGYSASGVVVGVGELVEGIAPGDRVAAAGAGYANHAEIISVPGNLCAHIPDGVTFDDAAYATLGAIALQGVRQADLRMGESVLVVGLGLLGLITTQLLRASGCVPIGYDPDPKKTELALQCGAQAAVSGSETDVLAHVRSLGPGAGVDAVIITASTKSSDPIRLAGQAARDRGVVVVVGDVGMDIPRSPFYEKELTVRLSRSYGPGRYDPMYEEYGVDYPVGYVRWTERRNMDEFLRLVGAGAVKTDLLTTHRFAIADAPAAYETVVSPGEQILIGVLLEYPEIEAPDLQAVSALRPRSQSAAGVVRVGMVGAGNFATSTLLPALRAVADVEFRGIATASGLSAQDAAERFGFAYSAESVGELFGDPDIDAVVIATRHDTHAGLVTAALEAGKHVFVEKPLALTREDLERVIEARERSGCEVMVGFNRRYSDAAKLVRAVVERKAAPAVVQIRVNAGFVPTDHWTQSIETGGGRIVGELCHFLDLAAYLGGGGITRVHASGLRNDKAAALQDSLVLGAELSTGSVASITYVAEGDSAYPKEQVEVFCGQSVSVIDDFRRVILVDAGKTDRQDLGKVDKGHGAEMAAFVSLVRGHGAPRASFAADVSASDAAFAVVEALCASGGVEVPARNRA